MPWPGLAWLGLARQAAKAETAEAEAAEAEAAEAEAVVAEAAEAEAHEAEADQQHHFGSKSYEKTLFLIAFARFFKKIITKTNGFETISKIKALWVQRRGSGTTV